MQFSSEREISDLKFIDSGTYGAIYLKDNKVIKKYHDNIRFGAGIYRNETKNPCLKYRRKKIYLLLMRNQFIKHTNLIEDVVFVQDKFVGVSYQYIEGVILDELISKGISTKSNISYQLIRNAEELTDFFIYPLDYKPNNILYDENSLVQIIDLDDIRTKVTFMGNPLYLYCSLYYLRRTIINFLENDEVYDYFGYYDQNLNLSKHQYASQLRKKKLISYQILRDYVALKCQEFDCSFIDCTNVEEISNVDFSFLRKLQELTFTKFILCISSKKDYYQFYEYKRFITQSFFEHSLDVYDLVIVSDETLDRAIENYLDRNNILHSITFRCPNVKENIDVDFCINFFNQDNNGNKKFIKK